MWPKQFKFFHEFMSDLRTIFMFNTIKSYPEGMTYYDLKKYGDIPHSKIYRMMKKLEEKGDLIRKDDISSETGRPKHLYFLSDQGERRLQILKERLGDLIELIILRFPDKKIELDTKKMLDATFGVWSSPVEYVLQLEISDQDKIEAFSEMESDLTDLLDKVKQAKLKILRNIEKSKHEIKRQK